MPDIEVKVGSTIKADCSRCGGERNCEIKGHWPESEDQDSVTFWTNKYILTCRGCDHSFFMQTDAHSEEIDYVEQPNGDYDPEPVKRRRYWPALSKREEPAWFQVMQRSNDYDAEKLGPILSELYQALNNDMPILTAIAVRTCFDVVSEVCKVEESLSFQSKIDELEKLGRITATQKGHLSVLVDAGGASAHRGWVPSLADINSHVDLLEDFLQNIFAVPALQKSLGEKAAKLHAKVPVKKKRPKTVKKK